MTDRVIDKALVVGALVEEWGAIAELLEALPDASWEAPSPLPGWNVRDLASHIIGTEASLSGESLPASEVDLRELDHVRNDIGALNEAWVQSLRSTAPAEVLARFRQLTGERAAVLEAMSQEEFDAPSWTPAGQGTYGRFMEIRVFDCWMHEQDMRDAVGVPGHGSGPCAELSIDEIVRALGYIVGKRAGAPEGSLVTFRLIGPVERVVHVGVDGRAAVVEEPDREPTCTLILSSAVFARLAGGRVPVSSQAGEVMLNGDLELGQRVLEALAFTI
ncbi:MAG: maleylpyruvate isomerase family mycothiol-dependent enzyme [Acidimicrobiales bacterium]